MASTAAAGISNNAGQFNNTSSTSYFQKTICLQDWWLIKVDTNGERERLGVAGFNSEQHALRLFSSAPISKLYGMCALETIDGIYVILNGLINKSRTLENGFSSEVFKHFLMGFPIYWEHFAEEYFSGSAVDVVSREDADRRNLSRGSPENSSKASGESTHIDGENLNTEAGDCLDMIPEPNFNTDSGNTEELINSMNLVDDVHMNGKANESSPVVEYPASVSYDKGNSLSVDGSSLPNFTAGVTENDPSPVAEFSKSLNLSGNLLAVDISSLPCAGEIINTTENSLIVENSQTCVDDSTAHQVLSNLEINVASMNINVDANVSAESNERNNCEFEIFRGSHKIRTRSSASKACLGNQEKDNRRDKSLNKPVDFVAGKSKRKLAPGKASGVNDHGRNKLNNLSANQDSASNLGSKSRRQKVGRPKKENKAGRPTSKPGVSDRKKGSKNAIKRKESAVKDASASDKKTKRKLTYGTPVKQGKEEGVHVVPIESLSCKRSRSGRLLLPSLEFWRNQTLVYDSDGRISGIKEVPSRVQPSRGSKSEPPKKKSKRLV